MSDGKVFVGCNIENSAPGLSMCAERAAFASAIAAGHSDFTAIAIAAHPLASPCGLCREFMTELVDSEFLVISIDADNMSKRQTWSMSQLLPNRPHQ